MNKSALIVGLSGIVGINLADHLVRERWTVHGLSRRPPKLAGVNGIAADVKDGAGLRKALAGLDVSHVFFCTWSREANEAENCKVNGAMLANLLAAVDGSPSLTHVALMTGLKHYLGPFEAFGKTPVETPFREEQPRLPLPNFYYVQEDMLIEGSARRGYGWSVHRAHTIIGYAIGNLMNMGTTLAAFAAICKATGRPFAFPGSPQQWELIYDMTDARLLARHLTWAATTPAARNEAFNVVNGEVFRWRWLWPRLAAFFDLEPAPYPGHANPLEAQMRDAGPVWDDIVRRHGLQPNPIDKLASWWHTDADVGRPIECFADMSKSRRRGFLDYQETLPSFLDLWTRLRREKIIP